MLGKNGAGATWPSVKDLEAMLLDADRQLAAARAEVDASERSYLMIREAYRRPGNSGKQRSITREAFERARDRKAPAWKAWGEARRRFEVTREALQVRASVEAEEVHLKTLLEELERSQA